MARTSKAKTEELNAKKAAEEAQARRIVMETEEEESDDDFSFDDDAGVSEEYNEELPDEADLAAAFDIFEEGGRLQAKGNAIKYFIKKNGEFLCIKYHPCSWEQIQKEFKGGQYQIVAKSVTTNKFMKQQTQSISDPQTSNNDHEEQTKIIRAEPAQPAQPSFMELFTLMNQMSEKKSIEAERQAQNKANESSSFMLAFLEMNKSAAAQSQAQQAQTQAMMLEIAKMNQAVSEKLAASQALMFDKMESRFEKIIEAVQTKDSKQEKQMSTFELIKMMEDSKNKGFELFAQISELAEEKADAKLALIESGDKGGKEPRLSMTDRLIEGILPTVATALASRAAAPAAVAQRSVPQQQRRAIPQADAQGRIQHRQRTNAPQSQPIDQNQKAGSSGNIEKGRADDGRASTQVIKTPSGLAKVDFKPIPVEVAKAAQAPESVNSVDKEAFIAKVTDVLTAPIIDCLTNGIEPTDASARCIGALNLSNISVNTFLNNVSNGDMMNIVDTFGLPVEAKAWFNELYANIKIRAGVVNGGESNINQK